MPNRLILWPTILLAFAAGCGKASAPPPPAPPAQPSARPAAPAGDVAEAAKGINAFALDLYAKLAEEKKGENIFFSPYSVSTALSMTYAGARGRTAAEMKKALRFSLDDARLHPAMGALGYDLNAAGARGEFQLSVANALWMQQGHKFLPGFLNLNKGCYGAGLSTLDFAGNTEGSRKTINDWVEKRTQEKIKDLIPPGMLGEATPFVLTNAIYFKGEWADVFEEKLTKPAPFKLPGGKAVEAPMMHNTSWFPIAEGDGFAAVELPYKGGNLVMLVLLPDKNDGLPALEKKLSAKMIRALKMEKHEVALGLPRFTLESGFRLDAALKSLDMAAVFDSRKADLSGIDGVTSPDEKLYVQAVVHKAFVDVNEKGTEAAAATGVVGNACDGEEPQRFTADHPFLFLIRDKKTGCILFMGRVTDPTNGTGKPVAAPPAEGPPAAAL